MPDRGPSLADVRQLGLYRIVFALGYLWWLALDDGRVLANVPLRDTQPTIALLQLLPLSPAEMWFQYLDAALIFALLLLALGSRVMVVTVVILVLGVLREAYATTPVVQNGNIVHVAFIPLLALLTGAWGAAFSVDRARKTAVHTSPHEQQSLANRSALMRRSLLILVSSLFVFSAVWKVTGGGVWLSNPDLLSTLMIDRSALSTATGGWANPLVPWLVDYPWIGTWMQRGVLLFEGTFWLVLLGRYWRRFFLALALVFHSVNELWLMIDFSPILLFYALFVPWETLLRTCRAWWQRLRARTRAANLTSATHAMRRLRDIDSRHHRILHASAWVIATTIAVFWHAGARALFTLGGVLTEHRMWMLVTTLAVLVLIHTIARVVMRAFTSLPRRAAATAS